VAISCPQKQKALLADCLDHMIYDGVCYTELSFDIRLARTCGGNWSDLICGWKEEIYSRRHQIRVSPEIGIARELERQFVEDELATITKNTFFEGIDLYGAELSHPIESFAYLMAYSKNKHWRLKAHSGEVGSGERLLHELQFAKPFAIQHGINAVQSKAALELLSHTKIQVNVCPWSNIYLSLVADYKSHPIRALYDAGVAVTIASDDYAIFGRSLSEEYCALYDQAIFSADELEKIRANGLRHYIPLTK
jgi:adenosine deaminase